MARPRIPVPEPRQLAEALKQLVTIEGVASRFDVSFTTAKKWVIDSGLNSVYESSAHQRHLKGIISEGPLRAVRHRIDLDLSSIPMRVG